MTVEEAKKIAKLECALEFCKKESMLEQYVSDEKWKYFDVAVNAIEKQIPKKLKVEYTSGSGVVNLYYFCPSCNSFRMESRKYCSNCGQSLDWEETFHEWGQIKAVENLETILEESKSK